MCSKSRVAPVNPLTLLRLELSAALVLAHLQLSVKEALPLKLGNICLCSDSTITLAWIKTEPYLLKTFVANRVAEIQNLSNNCEWRHVSSQSNPADLVSRGLTPQELVESNIWKLGPSWLKNNIETWPQKNVDIIEIPEKKKIVACPIQIKSSSFNNEFMKRFSSIKNLKYIVAFVLRFIHNIKNKIDQRRGTGTPEESKNAEQLLISIIQRNTFSKDIHLLKLGENLHEKSRLIPLSPFLDKFGILRVGGRLENANMPENEKHQILLPSGNHVTRLIIRAEHERLKHAGAQATLYSIRQSFWPLDGRNMTRKIIHQCIRCFRAKPRGVD